jgi:DNA-binding NtrC family response regulator
MERDHIIKVLKETGGNKKKAAEILGIERRTLYNKAKRLGIDFGTI